jgi:hypothetical protein
VRNPVFRPISAAFGKDLERAWGTLKLISLIINARKHMQSFHLWEYYRGMHIPDDPEYRFVNRPQSLYFQNQD